MMRFRVVLVDGVISRYTSGCRSEHTFKVCTKYSFSDLCGDIALIDGRGIIGGCNEWLAAEPTII